MHLVSAAGEIYLLRDGETCIGRADSCQIVVDDPRISRRHASVFIQGSTYLLYDHKSTNWTLLNGERVMGVARLKDGDEIQVAGRPFTFREGGADLPPASTLRPKVVSANPDGKTTTLDRSPLEANNQGIRLPSARAADAYRREREERGEPFPFVIYRFASQAQATAALLELPDFENANDSKKPITWKRYVYGVFGTESGKGTLFLGGPLLNNETWNQVANVLSKRGAILVNGRVPQATGPSGLIAGDRTVVNPSQVHNLIASDLAKFDRAISVPESNPPRAVLVFTAENDTNARRFLSKIPLGDGVDAIVVETPDSTWTHDETGIYIS